MQIFEKELVISSKYYKEILKILKCQSRLIGGCVRDAMLGQSNIDIDIVTSLLPDQVTAILAKYNIKVIPTGIKFGTVTAIFHDEKFEITTLRKDISFTGRHAEVKYGVDFAEDAARRDFTINALSYCPFEHKIYDYFGGIADLAESKVKFIGDPHTRIKEDFLRILRFFRFSAYYAKELDPSSLRACMDSRDGLKTLSKERIKWEMDKLIISKNAHYILNEMSEAGILPIIFPVKYFDQVSFMKSIDFAQRINFILDRTSLYVLLFYGSSQKNLIDLKFSNQESVKITSILNFVDKVIPDNINFCLKRIWLEQIDYIEYIVALVGTNKIDPIKAIEFIEKYSKKLRENFPISGNHLLELGIQGARLGEIIKSLKNLWIESDFILDKDQLLERIEKK